MEQKSFTPLPIQIVHQRMVELETRLLEHSDIWATTHTLESLRNELLRGTLVPWYYGTDVAKPELVLFTTVEDHPNARILYILMAMGENAKESGPITMTLLEEHARKLSCTHIKVFGRKGWEVLLKPYGFVPTEVVYLKTLDHRRVN